MAQLRLVRCNARRAQMELTTLNDVMLKRNCQLQQYREGKLALLRLPSQEEVMVSMGTSSLKVFRKGLLGWVAPKTVFSTDLAALGWHDCIPLTRAVMSVLLITHSLDLLSRARSLDDAVRNYGDTFTEQLMESVNREMESSA